MYRIGVCSGRGMRNGHGYRREEMIGEEEGGDYADEENETMIEMVLVDEGNGLRHRCRK